MKFRKKPVIIEANQFDGTFECMTQLKQMYPEMKTASASYHEERNEVYRWSISTLEGSHNVSKDDWIIKGVKGEFYPCKPDIFIATYETV